MTKPNLVRRLEDLFAPFCPICKESRTDSSICQDCTRLLPYTKNPCGRCGVSLDKAGLICGKCQANDWSFDVIVSAFQYSFPIVNLLHQYKFQERLDRGALLSDGLIETVKHHYKDKAGPEALIPIPLHPKRQSQRGFNQSIEICRTLSKTFNWRLERFGLIKQRPTEAQSNLALRYRKKNIQHAFRAIENLPGHVALIDDVVTSCSTVNEAAKTLKLAGVQRVDVLCLARTSR